MIQLSNQYSITKINFNNPIIQALSMLLLFVLLSLLSLIYTNENVWKLALTFNLLFIALNCIIGMQILQFKHYVFTAILSFVVLNVVLILLSSKISGITFMQTSSIRPIFLTLWVCYPIFISITFFIRLIAQMADNENI